MSSKLFNRKTGALSLDGNSDVNGNYLSFENGIRFYSLTIAVVANTTTTSAPAGSFAVTSNTTGKGKIYVSDGVKYQNLAIV